MYSTEELLEMRASGKYPIANLKIFEDIKRINLSNKTIDNIKWVEEDYIARIETITSLDERIKDKYLDHIKAKENLDNQSLEKEDYFFLDLYQDLTNETAIDYLLDNDLTKHSFIKGHKILLKGTSRDDLSNVDYRHNNDTYVSVTDENGHVSPYYFAIDYEDIPEAIDKIVTYYNSNSDQNVFEKPIINHGVISALQMFNDGNSRYARLLQYLKIHELTNKIYKVNSDKPLIYGTRAYFPYRDTYRQLMADLVTKGDNDTWNDWINFNLGRIQDRMYYEEPQLERVKTLIK